MAVSVSFVVVAAAAALAQIASTGDISNIRETACEEYIVPTTPATGTTWPEGVEAAAKSACLDKECKDGTLIIRKNACEGYCAKITTDTDLKKACQEYCSSCQGIEIIESSAIRRNACHATYRNPTVIEIDKFLQCIDCRKGKLTHACVKQCAKQTDDPIKQFCENVCENCTPAAHTPTTVTSTTVTPATATTTTETTTTLPQCDTAPDKLCGKEVTTHRLDGSVYCMITCDCNTKMWVGINQFGRNCLTDLLKRKAGDVAVYSHTADKKDAPEQIDHPYCGGLMVFQTGGDGDELYACKVGCDGNKYGIYPATSEGIEDKKMCEKYIYD